MIGAGLPTCRFFDPEGSHMKAQGKRSAARASTAPPWVTGPPRRVQNAESVPSLSLFWWNLCWVAVSCSAGTPSAGFQTLFWWNVSWVVATGRSGLPFLRKNPRF
jgi:hypothetical protein